MHRKWWNNFYRWGLWVLIITERHTQSAIDLLHHVLTFYRQQQKSSCSSVCFFYPSYRGWEAGVKHIHVQPLHGEEVHYRQASMFMTLIKLLLQCYNGGFLIVNMLEVLGFWLSMYHARNITPTQAKAFKQKWWKQSEESSAERLFIFFGFWRHPSISYPSHSNRDF